MWECVETMFDEHLGEFEFSIKMTLFFKLQMETFYRGYQID